jgi:hypothetical protein
MKKQSSYKKMMKEKYNLKSRSLTENTDTVDLQLLVKSIEQEGGWESADKFFQSKMTAV